MHAAVGGDESVGAVLRRARRMAALTQEELAARTGLSVRAIGDLERGRTGRPHSRSVQLLAQALDLSGPSFERLMELLRQQIAISSDESADFPLSAGGRAEGPQGNASQPGRASGLVPTQLPADIADFTGRGEPVAQLQRIVAAEPKAGHLGTVSPAVVVGAAGAGKTTLAVHTAHLVQDRFPDGQLFAELRGMDPHAAEPAEVLARFLRDLGVPPDSIPDGVEGRAAQYRSQLTGRRVLVVLDDARDAAQVQPLLPGSASCAVLVTSRRWLSELARSNVVALDVFESAEARQLFGTIIGQDRAAAERIACDEVLLACAGLPLAIRIAGARLAARGGWSVRAMADRLASERRRLDHLTAGSLAVRASFAVGVSALPAPDGAAGIHPAHAFHTLGLWRGPAICLDAAAALLGAERDSVADALEALVDAQLLQSPSPDRYQFHDLLKVYAGDRAMAEETEEARDRAVRRILAWYLHRTVVAARIISPYRDLDLLGEPESVSPAESFMSVDHALDWCELERANLVAATRYAAAVGLHDVAWKLPVAALGFFNRRTYCEEWICTHEIALDSARHIGDLPAEAWVLNNLGMAFARQGQDRAIEFLRQSLAIRRDIADQAGQAQTANNLAYACLLRKRPDEALEWSSRSLDLHRMLGYRFGEAIALNNLGEALLELGRPGEAIGRLDQALGVYREIGTRTEAGDTLTNLGRAYANRGDITEALDCLRQAEKTHREVGHRHGEAITLELLGDVYLLNHRMDDAVEAWNRAVALFETLGHDAQAREVRERVASSGQVDRQPRAQDR